MPAFLGLAGIAVVELVRVGGKRVVGVEERGALRDTLPAPGVLAPPILDVLSVRLRW